MTKADIIEMISKNGSIPKKQQRIDEARAKEWRYKFEHGLIQSDDSWKTQGKIYQRELNQRIIKDFSNNIVRPMGDHDLERI